MCTIYLFLLIDTNPKSIRTNQSTALTTIDDSMGEALCGLWDLHVKSNVYLRGLVNYTLVDELRDQSR